MVISLQIWKSRTNEFADGLGVRCEEKSTVKHNVYSRFFNTIVQIVVLFPKMINGRDLCVCVCWGGLDVKMLTKFLKLINV